MTADAVATRRRARSFGSFTRTRVERILQIAIAFGCIALGSQAFFAALGVAEEGARWHIPLTAATFASLLAAIVAALAGRAVRVFTGLFPVVYVAVLVLWPFAAGGSHPEPTGPSPWIFYLINVATVVTILAYPLWLQIVATVLIPLLYGFVRLLQTGFGQDFLIYVILDVSFALILGGILVALGWVFRAVADDVDAARARAVESYAAAAATDATEQERVSVAALMHDSVLAALLAISRATSAREQALAVAMAREALTRLANAERDAEIGSDAPIPMEAFADAVENAGLEFGVAPPTRRHIAEDAGTIPESVARALVLAATQAIANSIQHADGHGLHLEVDVSRASPRVTVLIADTGPGFDADAVPDDRLGIRASINARVAAVGGRTRIQSGSDGTRVVLEWDMQPGGEQA
ncbi:sensor histidine kinase [Microbacterium sp. ASV49]|uniref:ATP-binding protein n=1 Tax=Microbacterium candidum TaxID=3041922 RepID=A0ABT7N0P7_9MICO|nr:ATP-binding protein [Microbacterium sp. ASV49]MDL9980285.1 ATP-binding protein [Microbacterium sp. ASV49]